MWKDPIVEEIHAVREEIARKFDYDLKKIAADMRARQEENPDRVVRKRDLHERTSDRPSPGVDHRDAA